MHIQEFENRVLKAKNLDFGTIFNQSMELFKKVWLQGLIVLLLTTILIMPLYLLIYVPFLTLGVLQENVASGNELTASLFILFVFFMLIFAFVATVIGFGMRAGFYRICKLKDLNQAGTDDYFYYLKKPYLYKIIKLSLVIFAIAILATLLFVLPLIYVMVPITLMNVIFAFNPEQSVREIVRSGFLLGNKKWLITFGLIFCASLLAQCLGMLLCFIGVFVTASFAYIPAYYVYKGSIGFNKEEPGKLIESTY